MTENLLDGNNQDQFTIDANKDYLQELVGDGKKFKTPQDLARGKAEADAFIETLKRQQDELRADFIRVREENVAKAKLEELIDRLQNGKQPDTSGNIPPAKDVELKPFDPKELEGLIPREIEKYETQRKQSENFRIVQDKLTETFGTNYQTVLNQRIKELGLTADDINALARKSPNAFFNTLGINREQKSDNGFQSPPRSSQRSDNFAPRTEKRTWSYYQKIKKENPTLYYSPKITNQMHDDYQSLGTAFEDGDFHAI